MTVRFEESSGLGGIVSKFTPNMQQDIKEIILFNASFSANLHCPGCTMLKNVGQRESWYDYQGNLVTLHVYRERGEFIIEDCHVNP